MDQQLNVSDAIIVGAGPSGIAMAHTLKHKLNFQNFTIYEKLDGPGGTWRTNTYPGCGCDVPTHLYSFSFNLNPDWSKALCDQPEILTYMEATVDKFDLRRHMHFGIACLGAQWISDKRKWEVHFQDVTTKNEFIREASIFVSAVGGISEPRNVKFDGMEKFQGAMFHTARWDHSYDYEGKRMAIIGNGCSAAQVVPSVVKKVAYLKQFARSPQWYHERPNRPFTAFEKACFKYVPFWQRLHRLSIFQESDGLVETYMPGKAAETKRYVVEEKAKKYIYATAPPEYHDIIVPQFPLGCKRRIFDPNYLESLHSKNLKLVAEGIKSVDETGIISSSGEREEFDVIVLATGFQVQNFLTPMEIVGKTGVTLEEQWNQGSGAQAYFGTHVHNFPNFAILFGPNTFPAHNSALFACEVQVEFVGKSLFQPIIDHRASVVEVKEQAEDEFVSDIHKSLDGSVFAAGCSNWYINAAGRNAASWPGYASNFWWKTMFPKFADFKLEGGERGSALRVLHSKYTTIGVALFCLGIGVVMKDKLVFS